MAREGRLRLGTQRWGELRTVETSQAIEVLLREAAGEPLEFWTHDERQATAALSRALDVHGV